MFEFSFVSLLAAILAGVLVYHLFGKKIMGWVSKEEAALKAQLAVLEHRVGVTESALAPPVAASAPASAQPQEDATPPKAPMPV